MASGESRVSRRYDKENLLWQSTVAIKSDPVGSETEVLVLAAPIYYFTLSAQIQAPIQRIYNMNKPPKLRKMALLLSSYSPDVYDGAIGEYQGIRGYWGVEDGGIVTAKIDEQKTDATLAKVVALASSL